MSDLKQILPAQLSPEVPVNENFESLSAIAFGGKRHEATSGLVWGYYGGLYNGNTIADGTLTLTNAADNYIVVLRSSGVISVSTSSANSTNVLYAKLYRVTVAGSVVTATLDQRLDVNGLLLGGGGGGGGGGDASTNTAVSVVNEGVQFADTSGKLLKRATGTGLVNRTAGVESVLPALQCIAVACSDESTPITVGTAKVTFINPYATVFTVVAVVASLSTAQVSGTIFTVDINEGGASILSTKLTIDNTEAHSGTAATPAVISDASLAAYASMTVDVDQIGNNTAAGLKVYLLGWPA